MPKPNTPAPASTPEKLTAGAPENTALLDTTTPAEPSLEVSPSSANSSSTDWVFGDLPELIVPLATTPNDSWNLIALGIGLLVIVGIVAGVWRLFKKRPQVLSALDLARQQLAKLEEHPPRSQAAAVQCSQLLCQAWASHYREYLLKQPPLLILQKYAFLRQLPHPLQEPLLLFLAQCVDIAYRPEAENPPAKQLIEQTQKLLQASERHPPHS